MSRCEVEPLSDMCRGRYLLVEPLSDLLSVRSKALSILSHSIINHHIKSVQRKQVVGLHRGTCVRTYRCAS